jgi:YD repeat-containing protein
VQIAASYDATNGLTDYTWAVQSPSYNDSWDYAMSSFVAPFEPGREVATEAGQQPFGYTLAYDADGRLTSATPDTGAATTYTYDDAAGTITADTGNGAFTEVLTFDSQNRELSDDTGGTDPNAWFTSDVFAWSGDNLASVTYSAASQAASQTLSTVEVDTIQYQCAAARKGGTAKLFRPQGLRRPAAH